MPGNRPSSAQGLHPEFIKDLRILTSKVHSKYWEQYLNLLLVSFKQGSTEVSSAQQVIFASNFNLKLTNVKKAFRALAALSHRVVTFQDGATERAEDRKVVMAALSDAESSKRLATLFSVLESRIKIIEDALDVASSVSGVLPMFNELLFTIDARAIWEGEGQTVPHLVPIGSLMIDLDSGSPDRFTFQITQRKLDDLISELNTMKEQMTALTGALQQKGDE
jgi:hypothetical protein